MTNKHTYANISKDLDTGWYKVTITNTYDDVTLFGSAKEYKDANELPFVFKSADIAKDFISILPDNIELVNIKEYRCEHCHLCFGSYETYKLSIGDFEVYIKWQSHDHIDKGLFVDKNYMKTTNHVVDGFTTSIKPTSYRGYDVCNSTLYSNLTELINKLKAERNYIDSQKEEYNFELVQS